MKRCALLLLALAACKKGGAKDPPPAGSGSASPEAAAATAAAPAAAALAGTIAGTPFAPDVVMLLDSSDGGQLGFYQLAPDHRGRDRARCVEPMPSPGSRTMTKHLPIAEWQVGVPLESEIDDWGVTDIALGDPHPGTVRVTLSARDAASFRVAGTIELKSADGTWQLAGPFVGEYCPTKVVPRGDDAALAGVRWTRDAVDPATLATTPVAAVIAGAPASIAHATWREVTRYDGGAAVRRQELLLFAAAPADPCAERPMTRDAATIDTIAVWSVAAPVVGARVAGLLDRDATRVEQISEADVSVFEPDGARHWLYSQYFSAALAIDAVDDKQVTGRVFVALPDRGKTMATGAFTAVRCPPLE